jgi:hypothetical protein
MINTSTTIPSSTGLRLRRLAENIHGLGPAPLFHCMCELAAGSDPLTVFETYGRLPRDLIAAYHGDTFPPNVILLRPCSS